MRHLHGAQEGRHLPAHGRLADTGPSAEEQHFTRTPGGRLSLTAAGKDFFDEVALLQRELRVERHAGVSEGEYLTTLKVLQRFIHNTGGHAWHH
ncbi:hypothetical protein [Streptomyces sp. NPDC056983]|uniref:hypothetical protein n=1 Tax=Streptomyces sp. NPDC056983 TaxID=3345987 RepID=UPI003640887A